MASSSSWSGEADAVMMGLFARAMWARRVLTSPPRTSHAARRRLPATRVKSGHSRLPEPRGTVLRPLPCRSLCRGVKEVQASFGGLWRPLRATRVGNGCAAAPAGRIIQSQLCATSSAHLFRPSTPALDWAPAVARRRRRHTAWQGRRGRRLDAQLASGRPREERAARKRR